MPRGWKGLGWFSVWQPNVNSFVMSTRWKDSSGLVSTSEDDFEDVLWTDETSVQLETHRRFCCRKDRQKPRRKPRPKHPVKVHAWVGISWRGSHGDLHICRNHDYMQKWPSKSSPHSGTQIVIDLFRTTPNTPPWIPCCELVEDAP